MDIKPSDILKRWNNLMLDENTSEGLRHCVTEKIKINVFEGEAYEEDFYHQDRQAVYYLINSLKQVNENLEENEDIDYQHMWKKSCNLAMKIALVKEDLEKDNPIER